MWWVTGEAMQFIAGLTVGLTVAAAGLWTPPPPPGRGRHHRKDER